VAHTAFLQFEIKVQPSERTILFSLEFFPVTNETAKNKSGYDLQSFLTVRISSTLRTDIFKLYNYIING